MRILSPATLFAVAVLAATACHTAAPLPQHFTISGRSYDEWYRRPNANATLRLVAWPDTTGRTLDACRRDGIAAQTDSLGYFQIHAVPTARASVLCVRESETFWYPLLTIRVGAAQPGDTLFLRCSLHTGEIGCAITTPDSARR